MLYYEFPVGSKVYQLRLTTRNLIKLEQKIGCNPLTIFGKGDTVPPISTLITILWASLQQPNKSYTEDEVYDIYDEWIDDGHAVAEFIPIILNIYKVSGLIKEEEIKN